MERLLSDVSYLLLATRYLRAIYPGISTHQRTTKMKLPPYLLGATILFWGWYTGLWLAAIPLAIIYEGSRYINCRWELVTADFRNTSHVCTALLVVVLIYLLWSDRSLRLVFSFFQWLPIICAPLLVAQTYSTSDRVDLHALVFFKEDSGKQLFSLDLTYPYFAICILAASAANVRDPFFYLGAVILIGCVLKSIRSKRFSYWVFFGLLLLATTLGAVTHIGMHQLQIAVAQKTARYFYRFYRPQRDPSQVSTAIGDLGSVKLSNQIVLRLQPAPGETAPPLIRQATYNKYASGFWVASGTEFTSVKAKENTWFLAAKPPTNKAITIAESLEDEQGLLKLPDGSFQVERLAVEQVEQNQYGTVQITGESGLLSYEILYDPDLSTASPPTEEDLKIQAIERPAIAQVVAELGLADMPPKAVLRTVRQFFDSEFNYSLELALQRRNKTPLSAFLLRHRSGHCEYFATATALVLREVGIPTRYAVGYSVYERSKLERQYIVRGRHAHAWTLVYLDGKWQNFDTTPSAWIAIEDDIVSGWQYFTDFGSFVWFQFSRGLLIMKNIDLKYLLVLALPLGWIVIKRLGDRKDRKRGRVRVHGQHQPIAIGADSELYSIEQKLTEMGYGRDRAETWYDWLNRLENTTDFQLEDLHLIIEIHYRYCFDPLGITTTERERLRSICLTWLSRHSSAGDRDCSSNIVILNKN